MFIVHVAGHLGKDPETRFTPSGQKVSTFTIAVNHRKGKEESTTWVKVTVWGDRFDKMFPYMKKGSGVIVTGKMNPPSSYTDKEGRTQISLEIVAEMIEFSPFGKQDRASEGQAINHQAAPAGGHTPYEQTSYTTSFEDQSSNYGKPQAGKGASHAHAIDEDTLPF